MGQLARGAAYSLLNKCLQDPSAFAAALGYKDFSSVHNRWVRSFLNAKMYVMQAHRNAYKTTAGIVALAMLFTLFRDERVLIVRKTESNAVRILQAVRRLFETNEFLRYLTNARYGNASVESDPWTSTRITFRFRRKTLVEPSLTAVGIGTSITGAHFDLIWCDDVVTIDDRFSAAERERTKNYVMELHNILDPNGRLIITGTPWHKDDVFSTLPNPERYPLGSIPLPWYKQGQTEKKLQGLMTPSLFAANYLLKHIEDVSPEFPPPRFEKIPRRKMNSLHKIVYIDPAFGGRDFTAVVLAGSDSSGDLFILDAIYVKKSIGELWDSIENFFWSSDAKKIFYEENSAQRLIGYELQRRGIPCEGVRHVTNKYARIVTTLKPVWGNIVFSDVLADTEAMRELVSYSENATNDDFTDAVASCVDILRDSPISTDDLLDLQSLL